ncbi:MAG: hypothetical protein ABJB12_16140 [Pseudomonadota bacterium]
MSREGASQQTCLSSPDEELDGFGGLRVAYVQTLRARAALAKTVPKAAE